MAQTTRRDAEAAVIVRQRLRAAAQDARTRLWDARGGLQLLEPLEARQFAKLVGQLDQFIAQLEPAVTQR